LKPENILLDSEGHIKLTDFGLAKENFHRRNRGRTNTFCGTPEYLAPEVLRKEAYGFPVDWWCVGSVLYEMLVGLPPFYTNDVQAMYEKILNEKLKFPPYVGVRARSIISGVRVSI
jgi:serum/glucocorticoid-regulated kinase 3